MYGNNITIRRARRSDVDTLAEFNMRMAVETEEKELDPEVIASGLNAMFDNPEHGFYFVAEIDGGIAGCLMITTEWSDWRDGDFWWIQSVYVAKPFRRLGVLRALYEEAEKQAKSAGGVCGLRLYVERNNKRAQAAYAALGMSETDYFVMENLFL